MKRDYLVDKAFLLNAFNENRAVLLTCAHTWPPDKVESLFLDKWCLLDLLAHLSGWDEANREAVTAVQAGRLPEFYAHKDHDWGSFNAMHVRMYRRPTQAAQIVETERTLGSLMDTLEALDAEAFYRDYGVRYKGWKVIIARLVKSELQDERIHLEQMKAWLTLKP